MNINMKKNGIITLLLLGTILGVQAQKNDTTIVKDGNKEVKIIVKEGKDNKSKDVVVYKKYIITDSTDLSNVMNDSREEEEVIIDADGKKKIIRKQIVIIDENKDGKVVRKIDVNIPNMDSLQAVIEKEMAKVEVEMERQGQKIEVQKRRIEQDVEEWTQNEDETEIVVGDRKIFIGKDEDGELKVIVRKKNKEGEWIEEKSKEGDGTENWVEEKEIELVEGDNCNKNTCKKRKAADVDWFGLDLGWNNYLTSGKVGKVPMDMLGLDNLRSMHVTSHFLPTRVTLFGNGAVNLKSAISLDFNNFRYKDDFILSPDANYVTPVASAEPLKKNKLVTTFVQLPLLLNFKTRPSRESSVEFSVGGYAGYLLDAKTKRMDSENKKIKDHNDYNINPMKYGLTARLDFKWFDVYVNYNLSNFFADGQGPKTQIVEAGVNLLNY